jgi:hypothetical protein
MSMSRNRNVWMWVAIAAVAFTSVAQAKAGLQTARGYSHPVLEFLVRSHSQNTAVHSGAQRFTHPGSRRQASSVFHNSTSGALIAILPVWFVGLVSPLTPRSALSLRMGRLPAAPLLTALFQRPPPSLA